MTNIQAINLLKGLWQSLDDYCELNDEGKAAFCMAIEALSCSEIPNSSDTISREAAVDALDKRFDSIPMEQTTDILLLRKDLRELPSAQPEKRTEKRTETHSCDLISRAMLLEYIHNEPVGKMLCDKYNLDGVIKQLPSVQPQQIVRCKDCKYADDDGVCQNSVGLAIQDDDDFCSKAERRTDE